MHYNCLTVFNDQYNVIICVINMYDLHDQYNASVFNKSIMQIPYLNVLYNVTSAQGQQ